MTSASAPIEFATYAEMMAALSETFPAGGTINLRLENGWNDEPDYLYMEQACPEGREDLWEVLPEEALGEDLYEKVDSTVNRLVEENTLPGYTAGEKFHDLTWKASAQG